MFSYSSADYFRQSWPVSKQPRRRKKPALWLTILAAGLLVILLTACTQTMSKKPTRPTLTIIERVDGGIELDRENAIKMGLYIQELEAGYN